MAVRIFFFFRGVMKTTTFSKFFSDILAVWQMSLRTVSKLLEFTTLSVFCQKLRAIDSCALLNYLVSCFHESFLTLCLNKGQENSNARVRGSKRHLP